ncbi:hypothetical protein BDR07DRAFT_1495213 [Suillus spraguei]|nr:hypothetical protein BDR07DRAFT_1495213 [Suillus spraguei]
MVTKSGGQPLKTLIENNFEKGDATSAKSNRYWLSHPSPLKNTELLGIDKELAKQLKINFAFESISLDDIDAEFTRLEDICNAEKTMGASETGMWTASGRAFDFAELQRVDEGLVLAVFEDEIIVTDHDANEDGIRNIDSVERSYSSIELPRNSSAHNILQGDSYGQVDIDNDILELNISLRTKSHISVELQNFVDISPTAAL